MQEGAEGEDVRVHEAEMRPVVTGGQDQFEGVTVSHHVPRRHVHDLDHPARMRLPEILHGLELVRWTGVPDEAEPSRGVLDHALGEQAQVLEVPTRPHQIEDEIRFVDGPRHGLPPRRCAGRGRDPYPRPTNRRADGTYRAN